jgi:hypothetical protein
MKKNQSIRNEKTGETLTMLISEEVNGGTRQLYRDSSAGHRWQLLLNSQSRRRVERLSQLLQQAASPPLSHTSASASCEPSGPSAGFDCGEPGG